MHLKVLFHSEFPFAESDLCGDWMYGAIDVEEREFGVWFVDELGQDEGGASIEVTPRAY